MEQKCPMKLPKVRNPERYIGLYAVDFGDHSGVGFTAEEVAELLESERFREAKVYKVYNAYPDGRMELKGMQAETFQLEMGMFFYEGDEQTARDDYRRLIDWATQTLPPSRAKVHLARYSDGRCVTALIYPAEHNEEFSRWLLDGAYRTSGAAEGGIDAVRQYYEEQPEVLERHQLFGRHSFTSKTGEELLAATRVAVVR